MPPWMSLAEYNRRQHALYLLSLLERSGGDPKKLRELLERERRRLEEWRRKLEGMSDEEFYRMISGDPFGVASKSYYIERARKRLKELERIEMDAKTLLKYLHDDYENEYDRFGVEDFIGRYMRGYINRLKQLKKKLQQRKNSPLTSFAEEGGKGEEKEKLEAPRGRSRFKASKKPILYHDKSSGFFRIIEDTETGESVLIEIKPDPKLWRIDLEDPINSVGRVTIRGGYAPGVNVDAVEPVDMPAIAMLVKSGRMKPERIRSEIEKLIRTYINPSFADQVIKWLYRDVPMLAQIDKIFSERLAELEAKEPKQRLPAPSSKPAKPKAKPRRRLERPKKIYKWAGSRRALESLIKKHGPENVRVISKVPVGGWLLEIRTFS